MAERQLVDTRMIRTPVAGPEPCNTLVFLRCLVPGLSIAVSGDDLVLTTMRFQTEFKIDNYLQAQYKWYLDNTHVSATASLKFVNTTTDLTFLFAVDRVDPVLREFDGGLGFDVDLASQFQDDAFFGGSEVVMTASLTAYVLCYEPASERPRSGVQRTGWASAIRETTGWTELRGSQGLGGAEWSGLLGFRHFFHWHT